MGEDYDRDAKRWKSSWEHEYQQMQAAGLDPSNLDDLKAYRAVHGRPDDFTVLNIQKIHTLIKRRMQKNLKDFLIVCCSKWLTLGLT